MLRWIDTHNHLFVLPEEQQKKKFRRPAKSASSLLWCVPAVSVIWKRLGAVPMNMIKPTPAAFIRFTSDTPGKKI